MNLRAADHLVLPWPDYHAAVVARLARIKDVIAPDVDRATRRRLWQAGFLADKWTLFDLEHRGVDGFLSCVQAELTRNINGRHGILLDHKLAANRALRGAVDQPETLLSIHSGQVTAWPSWRRTIRSGEPVHLFVKPVRGRKGKGVVRAELRSDRVHWLDDALTPVEFIDRLRAAGADLVVERGVDQHPDMAALYPGTVHTLRMLVVRDPTRGRPRVGAARLRVGVAATGAIDNFSQGGISFMVDLATGVVGGGIQRLPDYRIRALEVHPDSGTRITGRTLPLWDQVMAVSVDAMTELPFFDYIAWDIAIGPERPCIIEGNPNSGVAVFQVHGPLLTEAALHRFYEHHGILGWGVAANRYARRIA